MYNKVAYIRNFVIILSFISTLLFGLEIYAEYNDIKTKYINEIISKLEILEGSNDKELSTTVKELKNKLILNKEEEFLFCAKKSIGYTVNLLFGKFLVDYSGLSKKTTFD